MELTIMSAASSEKHTIVWLEVNTPTGNLVIQDHHAPLITLVNKDEEISYCFKTGKKNTLLLPHGGILKVTRTQVLILVH